MALVEVVGLVVALVMLVALGGIVFMGTLQSKAKPASDGEKQDDAQDTVQAVPAGARRRGAMARGIRRRGADRAAASNAQDDSASESGSDEEEEQQGGRLPQSKKERRKQQKEEEREARQAAVERREQKVSTYEDRRKEQQERKDAVRRAQEEEIQRAAEERQKKEEEEAAQWMSMIKVEQEGTGETDDQAEGEGLLSQFIEYIKQRKTVPLEQLATEFKLRTTDVIDRVHGLETMGLLTGVMDERGKYIYISKEEMEAVANYITTKGRVAISDLAAKSNTFIDLEAKANTAAGGPQPALDFDSLLDGVAAA